MSNTQTVNRNTGLIVSIGSHIITTANDIISRYLQIINITSNSKSSRDNYKYISYKSTVI